MRIHALALLIGLTPLSCAFADIIAFGGVITQSTEDGTGPAVNNPALNNIVDDDNFLVTLTFTGSISAAGNYPLAAATLVFTDTDASVTENEFVSTNVSVTKDGTSYDLSLLGCLSTGSGCLFGNYLSANFSVPIADLNSTDVSAQPVFGLNPPLDLLEDDGTTEIQGSIGSYSYIPSPEPSQMVPLIAGLTVLLIRRRSPRRRG